MIRQRTVKSLVSASGVGLHTGARARIVLRPAAPDTGVVFRRVDLDPPGDIVVAPDRIGDTRLCSTLEQGEVKVATVEHLMSALAGLGIDNVYVDIEGPEVPIMDGSSAPFVYLIQSVGIEEQNAPKRYVRIKQAVEARDRDKWARFDPHDGFRIHFRIQFDHPAFESSGNEVDIDFADASYMKEIARARTFGFMHEVEWMRGQGLALGGSLDNAIVMDEYRVLNPDGLRYPNEFVKHKVLDAIGDLYMLGHPIIGAFSAYKSGHALNNQLLRELMAHREAWEYLSFEREEEVPATFLRLHAQAA